VEGDASAAAFLFGAAALAGGTVRVAGLAPGSRQGDLAFPGLLERMGATVRREGDVVVVTGGDLAGIDADLSNCPDLAPVLAAVAMGSAGRTEIRGVPHLRVKESDRIASIAAAVRALGGRAEERPDGLVVTGGRIRPGTVDPAGDHRIAMAFALPGLVVAGVRVLDPGCVDKSFPGFFEALDSLAG
jgi:3-phosphoshikimate 1-carboxyvinyltransferase